MQKFLTNFIQNKCANVFFIASSFNYSGPFLMLPAFKFQNEIKFMWHSFKGLNDIIMREVQHQRPVKTTYRQCLGQEKWITFDDFYIYKNQVNYKIVLPMVVHIKFMVQLKLCGLKSRLKIRERVVYEKPI